MKFLLVQISDIHLKVEADAILRRVDLLVAAASSVEPEVAHILLLATGDIAQSGNADEYQLAERFFAQIVNGFRARMPSIPVDLIILPGNHDCELSEPSRVRRMVQDALGKEPDKAAFDDVAAILAEPQAQFRQFLSRLRGVGIALVPASETPLTSVYDINKTSHRVVVNCYNTALCSERDEVLGSLVLPPSAVNVVAHEPNLLVISAFHHPYAWLRQENARSFRTAIEASSDLVLTGHEHVASHRTSLGLGGEHFTHVEAPVLQDRDVPANSGFNVFALDLDARTQRFLTFVLEQDRYVPESGDLLAPWTELPLNKLRTRGSFVFTDSHDDFLDEPGLTLYHRDAGRLHLRDFYVFPDLIEVFLQKGVPPREVRAETVVETISQFEIVLITGETYSGKTALAKMLCRSFYDRGDVPLLWHSDAQVPRGDRFRRTVADLVEDQYGTDGLHPYEQLDKSRKVIVIDDFHRSAATSKLRTDIIRDLPKYFGKVVLLADELFVDLADLLDPQERQYPHLRIQPLGFRHRNDLVEQWLSKDTGADVSVLARRITEVNRVIDNAIEKGCVPAYPVYVLALLQASEAALPVDANVSTHGYYYELLIKAELTRGSSQKETDVLTGYLAFLAFAMFREDGGAVTEGRLRAIHKAFETKYDIPLGFDRILSELCQKNMLVKTTDMVRFKHKHVYYYFVASYLRDHINDIEIRAIIRELVDSTHRRKSSDVLLFLVHLSKDEFIINSLLSRAAAHYPGIAKVETPKEVAAPGDLSEVVERAAYEERDVSQSRREIATARDKERYTKALVRDTQEELVEVLEPIRDITSALHTLQVLGQVLKNYPGHLEAQTKLELVNAGYGIGTRAWRSLFNMMSEGREDIARQLIDTFRASDPEANTGVLQRRAIDTIDGLICLAGVGFVRRMSEALGAPELFTTYEKFVAAEGTDVALIVKMAIHLDHSPNVPEGEIVKTYGKMAGAPFSEWIIKELVVSHFHFFPVPAKVKQRICAKLEIKYRSGLESQGRPKLIGGKAD